MKLFSSQAWEQSAPWIYPVEIFGEDAEIRRPMVPVVGPGGGTKIRALVDSGALETICSLAFFEHLGGSPEGTSTTVRIGGKALDGIRSELNLAVASPSGSEGVQWIASVTVCLEWPNAWPWQMVLGQEGFFDRFTVAFGAFGQEFALEPDLRFVERFGVGFPSGSERMAFPEIQSK